jgi:hypothetical protein
MKHLIGVVDNAKKIPKDPRLLPYATIYRSKRKTTDTSPHILPLVAYE